jgi:hypothetical protein
VNARLVPRSIVDDLMLPLPDLDRSVSEYLTDDGAKHCMKQS